MVLYTILNHGPTPHHPQQAHRHTLYLGSGHGMFQSEQSYNRLFGAGEVIAALTMSLTERGPWGNRWGLVTRPLLASFCQACCCCGLWWARRLHGERERHTEGWGEESGEEDGGGTRAYVNHQHRCLHLFLHRTDA